ncbi:hypothetical protein PFLUV_G00132430, partial [Perca fluviatilis]
LSLSLPLSISLYRSAFFLSPLPFLSIPPLRDGVCRCCSGCRGLTCTQREDPPAPPLPSSDLLHIPRVSLLTVSSTTASASQLSPHPTTPRAGVWELGPWGWRESTSCFAGELCRISYALPRNPMTGWISTFLSACAPADNIG